MKWLLLCLVLLIVTLSGCTEKRVEINQTQISPTQSVLPPLNKNVSVIAFDSIDKGNSFTAEIEKPTIFVAGSRDEASQFIRWMENIDVVSRIEKVDFNTNFVIAVFRGKMGNSGYGIEVQSISIYSGVVQLAVNLTDPAPGQAVADVISYPYHIILLPREKLQVAPGTWAMYDPEGKVLAQMKRQG